MIVALGLALNGWCQDVQEIMNIRTPNHVQFEDFDYAIIPPNTAYQKSPSGFVSSFVNDSDDIEIELTQTPTSTSGDSLAEKAKAAAAVWKEYRIDGHKAFLFKEQASQQGEGALTLLYFGENFPLTIRATYPASIENRVYDGLVKAELSLIYVGPNQQSDGRFENSVFSIVNGGFKAQKIGQLLTTFSYRVHHPEVVAATADQFPMIRLINPTEVLGTWDEITAKHFDADGILDQLLAEGR